MTSMTAEMADTATLVDTAESAHAVMGGFLARCSLMNYRAAQMIATWFSEDDRFKPLTYVMHDLPFANKRDVVALRLTADHPEADALRAVIEEADRIMQRRDLVAHGLLSSNGGGVFQIKSHSAGKFLRDTEAPDILAIDELRAWSARAVTACEEMLRLAELMRRRRRAA
jgi:hypothetical protein